MDPPSQDSVAPFFSRVERQKAFHVDCEDEIVWRNWAVGRQSTKQFVLKNISSVKQTFYYNGPATDVFSVGPSEHFTLPPGMSRCIPVSFLPKCAAPVVETLEFLTQKGSFSILIKAVVKEAAVTFPREISFGCVPVNDETTVPFLIHNTGSLPARVTWKPCEPFQVLPRNLCVPVGQSRRCAAVIRPHATMVYEATLVLELAPEDDSVNNCTRCAAEDGIDKESNLCGVSSCPDSSSSPGSQSFRRFYELALRGIGKLPHLHVGGQTEVTLNFGDIPSGTAASKTIMLENASSVKAHFRVTRLLREEEEHHALIPYAITSRTCMGVVQPGKSCALTFDFEASAAMEAVSQQFQVSTSGGVPVVIRARGSVKPLEVTMSHKWLDYKKVPVGWHRALRCVQLRNASKRPVSFQFDNANPTSFISIEPSDGTLPPRSVTNVTFSLLPRVTVSFHKRVFCIVQHLDRPLVLDIVGSCCTNVECPPSVSIGQVYLKRWRELNASIPTAKSLEYDCQGVLTSAPEPPETTATLFREMMQDESFHASRDLTLLPGTLKMKHDGSTRVLMIKNRTDRKWICTWKDAYSRRQTGYKQVFRVYPARADVLPRSTASFEVSYDGHGVPAGFTDHCQLEAVLHPTPPASHKTVDVDQLRVPVVLSCYARGSCLTPCDIPLSPDVYVSEPKICFKNCAVGGCSFRTTQLVNNGDTAVSFDLVTDRITDVPKNDSVPHCVFRIWPSSGCIPPRSSRALVLSFEPRVASNWSWISEEFHVVLNENASFTKSIRVFGRAWEPLIDLVESPVVFATTPLGSVSESNITLRNASNIQIKVSAELSGIDRNAFTLNPMKEFLGPSEETSIHCKFAPLHPSGSSALLSVTAETVYTDDAIQSWVYRPGSFEDVLPITKKTEFVSLIGRTAPCPIKVSPASITLGPLIAHTKSTHEIILRNESDASTLYKIQLQPRLSPSCEEKQNFEDVGKSCEELTFRKMRGELTRNSTERIVFDFHPKRKQRYRCRIQIIQLRYQSSGGIDEGETDDVEETACQQEELQTTEVFLEANVVHPAVQILDVRCLNRAVAPSRLWQTVNAHLINRHFADDVQPCEVDYLKAEGLDERHVALQKLQTFDMDFGAAPIASEQTIFLLTLHNPGLVPVKLYFETVQNWNLQETPFWGLHGNRSNKEHSEDPVCLEPRALRLEVDESAPVLLALDYKKAGLVSADVILSVEKGRCAVLRLKRNALASEDFPFYFRKSIQVLQPVRLGSNPGPRQVFELVNFGSSERKWRLQLKDNENISNGFPALRLDTVEGCLQPSQATHVSVTFTPLQEGKQEFSIVCREADQHDNRPSCLSRGVELRVQACGQLQPLTEHLLAEGTLPDFVTRDRGIAPVMLAASVSSEVIMLPHVRRRSLVHRILILRNNHKNQTLRFRWDKQQLFSCVGELTIVPSTGILPPGGHCITHCIFRSTLEEFNIDGEIVCWTSWDLSSRDSHITHKPPEREEEIIAAHGKAPRTSQKLNHNSASSDPIVKTKAATKIVEEVTTSGQTPQKKVVTKKGPRKAFVGASRGTIPPKYLESVKPTVALYVRIFARSDSSLEGETLSFPEAQAAGACCPLPQPPYLRGIMENEHIFKSDAEGPLCSDVDSEEVFIQQPALLAIATQILTDMVHEALHAECTQEFVEDVINEASPPFASLFPTLSNAIHRQPVANELLHRGESETHSDDSSTSTSNISAFQRQDVYRNDSQHVFSTPWGMEIREDYRNWSPLVMNFLHCLPVLDSPTTTAPGPVSRGISEKAEEPQEDTTPLVDYLASLPNLNLEALPIIVSTVFRHFIVQAIEQMLYLKEPEDGFQQQP